jgi:hypothetical protein
MKFTRPGIAAALSVAMFAAANAGAADTALDYDYYQNRVEPIFFTKRPGHARCTTCHVDANNAFKLQKFSGQKDVAWTEEESRKNFTLVSALVTPGNPDKSHLLLYPLAPEAGGAIYHSGGRQFANKNSAEWKTIAAWVKGAKLTTAANTAAKK